MMKFILIGLLIFPAVAMAEGSCPPGQYPVGGQGARGCAPIPSGGGASGPVATGKWKKTWGAIAIDKETGQVGASVGSFSKSKAVEEAVARCARNGAKGCTGEVYSYKNQCLALATASNGRISWATGKNTDVASALAKVECEKVGICEVIYKDCSGPFFIRY